VTLRRSLRSGCVGVSRHAELFGQRCRGALRRCAGVVVLCVDACDALRCVYSSSRLDISGSLATFTRCLQLLCCCVEHVLHVHGIAVVAL
jgi:hypothetical protein